MTENFPKTLLMAVGMLLIPALIYMAFTRPEMLTDGKILAGILLIEVLCAAVWQYRRTFLTIVIISFLLAGSGLPLAGGVWTILRWGVLGAGAVVGSFIMLKERTHHFGLFHVFALFAVMFAGISALASRYPGFASLKAASLGLLFLYGATGARLASSGREGRFLAGLLTGCEIFVGGLAAFYLVGSEVMGNPNSLGAVVGVVGAPVLLWGILVSDRPSQYYRRVGLYAVATYLLFYSRSRAGMAAAFLSCAILCLALRRYKMLIQGVIILVIAITSAIIFYPDAFTSKVSSLTSSIVYKDKDTDLGLFSSRETPWEHAKDVIQKHFWFGTGFGTTENGVDASSQLGTFATVEGTTSENGSSYLSIVTWVGTLGVLPFILLLGALAWNAFRTCIWMLNSGNARHPAVPLAVIATAGLIHAAFEDWMFAPGYYLCVFFWSMSFILIDVAPWVPVRSVLHSWRSGRLRHGAQVPVPSP